jgi:hypothetical protein
MKVTVDFEELNKELGTIETYKKRSRAIGHVLWKMQGEGYPKIKGRRISLESCRCCHFSAIGEEGKVLCSKDDSVIILRDMEYQHKCDNFRPNFNYIYKTIVMEIVRRIHDAEMKA